MISRVFVIAFTIGLFFNGCQDKTQPSGEEQIVVEETPIKQEPQVREEPKKEETNKSQKISTASMAASIEDMVQESNAIFLKTTTGEKIKLISTENGIKFPDYPDKIVLLDFFATWCPPCRAAIPHLNSLQAKYKDTIQVIAILMEENKENSEIERFITKHKLSFPVSNSKENFILSQALGGIRSLPTMVMYDKKGNYHTHYVGVAPEEMIDADIQKALKK
jgi:thiol-disulfide isomerase/thioredoxin